MENTELTFDPTNLPATPEDDAPAVGLLLNETITRQLHHRTIRAFTDQAVGEDVVATLLDVARHGATSSFYQAVTIIRVKDPAIRDTLYQSSGQPYVGGSLGELFVFVVDLSRVARVREAAGLSLEPIERSGAFIQGVKDTMIAAQNMVIAAESLGLGTCYLGSIGRDPRSIIEAMKLPKFTFPLVGMLIGHPNQAPQMKPRLPRSITTSVDTYPDFEAAEYLEAFADYDETIQTYYDLRESGKRQDSYTNQLQVKPGKGPAERTNMLQIIREQGMCQD
ncbi:NADPH-dependent oxidoreductase [Actinomyces minihominis]|uniref:NADPH-dependent oxidoreductase n=1 Tax=Actinomyces minihominis TaxID=2002838 RepID=UPI000C06ACC2|nr:NADPH-dependent oxidoreductase [Actinomyces minihominis]